MRYNSRMEKIYQSFFYPSVKDFVERLPFKDSAKIWGTAETMETGDLHSPKIKTLRGPIKELIVRDFRIVFFIHEHIIHFVRAFRKKSAKTPRKEIEYAEQVYKML